MNMGTRMVTQAIKRVKQDNERRERKDRKKHLREKEKQYT